MAVLQHLMKSLALVAVEVPQTKLLAVTAVQEAGVAVIHQVRVVQARQVKAATEVRVQAVTISQQAVAVVLLRQAVALRVVAMVARGVTV